MTATATRNRRRSPTLGIRLAISCAIFTALDTTDVCSSTGVEWRGSRTRRESPAGSSTAPPTTQANIKLVKVAEIVQQVLEDASLTGDTRRQLDIVQASFGNIETTMQTSRSRSGTRLDEHGDHARAVYCRCVEAACHYFGSALETAKELRRNQSNARRRCTRISIAS